MKKTLIVFAILVIIVSQSICYAQDTSSSKYHVTMGYPNGRFWLHMNNEAKQTFLIGLSVGGKLFREYIDGKKICNDKDINEAYNEIMEMPKAELKDIVGQINSFYADSSNLNIPISRAHEIAVVKFKGESPQVIEEYIAELRKAVNKSP